MDTQLCKAKTFENKWVTGYYFECKNEFSGKMIPYIISNDENAQRPGNMFYIIDIDTICRCTGCHDKNGILIFENDILDNKPYNVVSYCNGEKESYGMNVGWYIQRDNFESWRELNYPDECEVTGNIFD